MPQQLPMQKASFRVPACALRHIPRLDRHLAKWYTHQCGRYGEKPSHILASRHTRHHPAAPLSWRRFASLCKTLRTHRNYDGHIPHRRMFVIFQKPPDHRIRSIIAPIQWHTHTDTHAFVAVRKDIRSCRSRDISALRDRKWQTLVAS